MTPQVILPAQGTICICEAIRCVDCGCCAPAGHEQTACCARCAGKHDHPAVTSGKPCRGCLHFVQDSQPPVRPEARAAARDFAPPPVADVVAVVPAIEAPQVVRLAGWKALLAPEAPPDLRRALPLLI